MICSRRIRWFSLAVLGLAVCCWAPAAQAQVVLTGWSFEGATVAATPGQAPTVTAGGTGSNINSDLGTVFGTATALHAGAATVYSTPAGNGSTKSFSSNTWATGDYYQFSTSTTGQTGIQLLFDATSSGTGPSGFKVSYSTDGGSTFADLPGGTYTNSSASSFSAGTTLTTTPPRQFFDGGGAFDNIASLVVRLVDTSTTGAAAGTSRVDNFEIGQNLATVPEPTSLAMVGGVAVAGLYRRFRRKSA
jgi:hypothetical protein